MQGDFLLLDRSGSMQDKWDESLTSINSYVTKLAKEGVDTAVTLAVFDKQDKLEFLVIRDKVKPAEWKEVTKEDAAPRGWTPLNDAIGRIVGLANQEPLDKAAIIIMTDGLENCSREFDHAGAKKLLEACRAKGWQVIFLGVDYENTAQAASYDTAMDQTIVAASGNTIRAMGMMAQKRGFYGVTGQSVSFSDEEKAGLAKKE